MSSLRTGSAREATLVDRSVRAPVEAERRRRSGDSASARAELLRALDATGELMASFGHDHLTPTRLGLAVELAGWRTTVGDGHDGRLLAGELLAVVGGDRDAWPFSYAAALRLPLDPCEQAPLVRRLLDLLGDGHSRPFWHRNRPGCDVVLGARTR